MRDMEYLDALWGALPVVAAWVLAASKNQDPQSIPGAARGVVVRWLDGSLQKKHFEHFR